MCGVEWCKLCVSHVFSFIVSRSLLTRTTHACANRNQEQRVPMLLEDCLNKHYGDVCTWRSDPSILIAIRHQRSQRVERYYCPCINRIAELGRFYPLRNQRGELCGFCFYTSTSKSPNSLPSTIVLVYIYATPRVRGSVGFENTSYVLQMNCRNSTRNTWKI